MKITAQLLREKRACAEQVLMFERLYPRGCTVTQKRCVKHATLFNWDWAAKHLMSEHWDAYWKACQPHWDAYGKACLPHWDAYEKARQPHWDAYKKARQPRWDGCAKAYQPYLDAYWKACQPHLDAYGKACLPHWDACAKARAMVFARLAARKGGTK